MAQALVGIDVRREQRSKVSHARLLTTNEVIEAWRRFALCITEHITPAVDLDHTLVNVHGATRGVRQRFGHAHYGQAVLERDFFE
ncbi:hypothetical protein D3C78_1636130 [compost metagenome]